MNYRKLLVAVLFSVFVNPVQAEDFERFYLSGANEVCGKLPNSCRNPSCGIDSALPNFTATCIGRGQYSENTCKQRNPTIPIKDEARERKGIALTDLNKEVSIVSSASQCQWDSWEERTGWPEDPNGAGVCCSPIDISGDCVGLPEKPCYEEVNSCDIEFRIFAICENELLCGTKPATCNNIVFGINETTILELSPQVENEKLFRNAINSISINYKAELLSNFEASERAKLAETSFEDVEALSQIIAEEEDRRD